MKAIAKFLSEREDGSIPERDGWPWPWDDSRTTDYIYTFDSGKIYASCFGHAWFEAVKEHADGDGVEMDCFPDMSKWKKVAFGKRSGLLILRLK